MTRSQHRAQKTWSEKTQQELQEEQQTDAEIKEIAAYLKKRSKLTPKDGIPYASWDANFNLIDDIVVWTKKNKIMPYIPISTRSNMLKALHDAPLNSEFIWVSTNYSVQYSVGKRLSLVIGADDSIGSERHSHNHSNDPVQSWRCGCFDRSFHVSYIVSRDLSSAPS